MTKKEICEKLKSEGYTYTQIAEKVGLSGKGAVAYYLTPGESKQAKSRLRKNRANDSLYRRSFQWEGFESLKKSSNSELGQKHSHLFKKITFNLFGHDTFTNNLLIKK